MKKSKDEFRDERTEEIDDLSSLDEKAQDEAEMALVPEEAAIDSVASRQRAHELKVLTGGK